MDNLFGTTFHGQTPAFSLYGTYDNVSSVIFAVSWTQSTVVWKIACVPRNRSEEDVVMRKLTTDAHAIVGEIASNWPAETEVRLLACRMRCMMLRKGKKEGITAAQLIGISAHTVQRSLEDVDLLGELLVSRTPVIHVALVAARPRKVRAPEGHYWCSFRGYRNRTHIGHASLLLEILQHRGNCIVVRCRLSLKSLGDPLSWRVNVDSFVATRDRHGTVVIDINPATDHCAGRAQAPVKFPRFPSGRSAAGKSLLSIVRHGSNRADLIKLIYAWWNDLLYRLFIL